MDHGTKLITIVGARPQFVKAAAVSRAIQRFNTQASPDERIEEIIVHTGQHYDTNMSQVFFDELRIPKPRYNLEVGSGTHGRQTGAMLERIEQVLFDEQPTRVLVYGDTNSTLAAALAAVKLHIPVAHVEAGLRSFNRRMPEEINRIVADCVSDLLLCPTQVAVENLTREGITRSVHLVGDVMYDSVLFNTTLAEERNSILSALALQPKTYILATIHRAENTDEVNRLTQILDALGRMEMPVVLPLHPRTRSILQSHDIQMDQSIRIMDPVSYLDMLMLEKHAWAIFTDSGGMQKEAYFFGVPCVTLRDETEWTELVGVGANFLAGNVPEKILEGRDWVRNWTLPSESEQLFGNGKSSDGIVELLTERS